MRISALQGQLSGHGPDELRNKQLEPGPLHQALLEGLAHQDAQAAVTCKGHWDSHASLALAAALVGLGSATSRPTLPGPAGMVMSQTSFVRCTSCQWPLHWAATYCSGGLLACKLKDGEFC